MKINFPKGATTGRVLIVLYLVVCIVEGYNVFPIRELTSESIRRYSAISERAMQKLGIITQIRLNLDNIETAKFKHILNEDREAMRAEMVEINRTTSSNDSLFKELRRRIVDTEEETYFKMVLENRWLNMESRKHQLRLSMSGEKEKAIEYFQTTNEQVRLEYGNAIEALTEHIVVQTKRLTTETHEYIIQKRKPVDAVLLLSVILVVITGLVVFAVNRKLNLHNAELAVQEKKYRDMVDNTDEMMSTHNANGEIIWANRSWKENTQYTDDDIKKGLRARDILDDETKAIYSERFRKIMNGESVGNAEGTIISKSGEKVFVFGKSIPVKTDGKITGLQSFLRNITVRKQAEQRAQESAMNYQRVVENIHDGVCIDDVEGKVIFANKQFCEMHGVDESRIPGLFFEDYLAPEYRTLLRDRHSRRIAGEKVPEDFIFEGITKDGARKLFEVRVTPIVEKGKVIGTQSIHRDITESKEAEEKLIETSMRLQNVLNIFDNSFWGYDVLNKKMLYVSPGNEKVFGYPEKDFLSNSNLWFEVVLDEDKPKFKDVWDKLYQGRSAQIEFRIKMPDNTIKWIESKMAPSLMAGQLSRIDGIAIDINERKNDASIIEKNMVELKKTNEELDRFVYSTSHDLRAPLLAIQGLLDLMEHHAGNQKEVALYNGTMRKIINQMDDTIKEILDYSRNARLQIIPEQLDVNKMVENSLRQISQTHSSSNIAFSCSVDDSVPFYSDKMRFTAIVNNLLVNAFKYVRDEEKNPFVKVTFSSGEKEGVLTVEDNGEGIEPEYREKIFEMFLRVSEKSDSSGLGLYICREITDKLNGSIEVSSVSGKGSIFTVRIPNLNNTIQS
ncbi:MAG TPA: PAS domain S-box protein [Bacteroidia bacterium]|nr:PAS domain S-box protein [Bacteroidia bacterium]